MAARLRIHKARGGQFNNFIFEIPEDLDRAGWFIVDCEEDQRFCATQEGYIFVFHGYHEAVAMAATLKERIAAPAIASVPALMTLLVMGERLALPMEVARVYNARVARHCGILREAELAVPVVSREALSDPVAQTILVHYDITPAERQRVEDLLKTHA